MSQSILESLLGTCAAETSIPAEPLKQPWANTAGGRAGLMQFKTGEAIFREGEDPRGVHILRCGEVDLLFSARNGTAKPLRAAQPGQVLGLSCVVNRRSHDCTATARTPCEVSFIERDDFLRALDDRPAVWFSILRLLSSDINAVYHDIRQLAAR